MRSLRSALLDEALPRLVAIAEAWEVSLDHATSQDLVQAILAQLVDPVIMAAVWHQLPSDSQRAWATLAKGDGRMPFAAFERQFGVLRPMGPARLERERPWLQPANTTETLWYRGLIFRAFDRSSPPIESAFIPPELLVAIATDARLRVGSDPVNTASERAPAHDVLVAKESGSRHERVSSWLLDDCVTILSHVQANPNLTASDWPSHVLNYVAVLLQGTRDQAQFAAHLIRQQGWLRLSERGNLRLNARGVVSWLNGSARSQLNSLREAWLASSSWNELEHIDGISLEMRHSWRNNPVEDRAAVIKVWERWQSTLGASNIPGVAVGDAVAAFAKEHCPDFLRPSGRYDTWQIRDTLTGKFLGGFEHWDRVEGAVIRTILQGPVAWLSATAIHELPPDQAVLNFGESAVFMIQPWSRFERFQLARVADAVSYEPNVGYGFQFSNESLTTAKGFGIGVPRIIEFLERTAAGPLPVFLRKALERWGANGVEAKVEQTVIVRLKDSATLDSLINEAGLKTFTIERLAGNALAFRSADASQIRAALLKVGIIAA